VIFFKKAGDRVSAVALNYFKNVVSVILLVPALLLAGQPFFPHRSPGDWTLLAGSGLLGIALADTLFFVALSKLGASRVAIVDTLYSPFVIVLSFVFIGERLNAQALIGAALVVGAVLIGAAARGDNGRTPRDVVVGVFVGALAMLAMGVGIVMIKRLLADTPVLWTTAVRMFFATLGMTLLAVVPRWRREVGALLRPSWVWRHAAPGAVIGCYVSSILWIAGMKYTLASAAAILNQLSTIFIFVLAAIFLRERMTLRRSIAVIMAMIGATLVALR